MWFSMRNTLGPLLLMLLCPPFVMLMWYANTTLEGSLLELLNLTIQQGIFQTIYTIWKPYFFGSSIAWQMIACFTF